jgi:hypothetical protein
MTELPGLLVVTRKGNPRRPGGKELVNVSQYEFLQDYSD